jgi:branched-chain amino acid transport system ATP-binding protein
MPDFLTVENIGKSFGGLRAVDGVSFTLAAGELAAIIGPNGAGKTTLFNLIAGAFPPSRGAVRFRGKRVRNAVTACTLGIGRTFQNVRLFREMTVLENVLVGMDQPGFFSASLRLPGAVRAERAKLRRAYSILEDIGLESFAATRAGDIPFGRQRLLEIGRALALSPQLLLLDEPAAGLNRTETTGLAALIRRIRAHGVTMLLVEHDMHLVMHLVERVIVLESGGLIADAAPAEVRNDPRVCAAYLGASAC